MILSKNDPRLGDFKYKIGDEFLFLPNDEDSFDKDLLESFGPSKPILSIISYEISQYGQLEYKLEAVNRDLDWNWHVNEIMLDEDFIPLPKDINSKRLLLLSI